MKRCLNCMEEYEEKVSSCPACGWTGKWKKTGCQEPGNILQGRYIVGTCREKNPADFIYIGWDALFSRKVLIMEYFPKNYVCRKEDGTLKIVDSRKEEFRIGLKTFTLNGQKLIILDGTKGLLNVFGIFNENNTAYMVMEYPGKKTLKHVLEIEEPWSLEQTKKLIRDLSYPLSAAHRLHFYHGQLSLEHCYILESGEYRIGCFNESRYLQGIESDIKRRWCRVNRDIFGLADIAGAALMGTRLWENYAAEEKVVALKKALPEYAFNALAKVMSKDVSLWPQSLLYFVDEFTGETTTEILPAQSQYTEEMVRRTLLLWEKQEDSQGDSDLFDKKGGL